MVTLTHLNKSLFDSIKLLDFFPVSRKIEQFHSDLSLTLLVLGKIPDTSVKLVNKRSRQEKEGKSRDSGILRSQYIEFFKNSEWPLFVKIN